MAKYGSADVGFLLLGPYNLTSVSSKLEDSVTRETQDITPFGVSTAALAAPALAKFEISGHEAWYDDATDSINAAMVGMASTATVFMMAIAGNVNGRRAVCSAGAIRVGYKRSFSVGEYHKASMDLAITGARDEATIVHALSQVSDDGNTETVVDVDLGAAGGGTTGANVYLSCTQLALTGSTNLLVTFEDSVDGNTYASQQAMTALTTVGAEYKATTDQTVNRYVACKWVFTGKAGTPTATFALAVKVNAPHA